MNKIFRVIWSRSLNLWVVVSELAHGRVKASSTGQKPTQGEGGFALKPLTSALFTPKTLSTLGSAVVFSSLLFTEVAYAARIEKPTKATNSGYQYQTAGEVANQPENTGRGHLVAGDGARVYTGDKSGRNFTARSRSMIALGHNALAGVTKDNIQQGNYGDGNIAIGANTKSLGYRSIAFGSSAIANGTDSVAFGRDAWSNGNKSIVVGAASENLAANSLIVGHSSKLGFGSDGSVVLGSEAGLKLSQGQQFNEDQGRAMQKSTFIGYKATGLEGSHYAFAIGAESHVSQAGAGAIGYQASSSGEQALAVGYKASSSAEGAVALGKSSSAEAKNSTVVGADAKAEGDNATVLGAWASGKGENSLALGRNAQVEAIQVDNNPRKIGHVALGSWSRAEHAVGTSGFTQLGIDFGKVGNSGVAFKGDTPPATVSIGGINDQNRPFLRQLQGVAAGRVTEDSSDAINGSQLYAVAAKIPRYMHVNSTVSTSKSVPNGNGNDNIGSNQGNDGANGANSIAIGPWAFTKSNAANSVAIGAGARATGTEAKDSVAVGVNAWAGGQSSVALGQQATTASRYGIAVGALSNVGGRGVVVGSEATAQDRGVAIGPQAVSENNAIVIGSSAIARTSQSGRNVTNSVLIGQDGRMYGDYSVAVGQNSRVGAAEGSGNVTGGSAFGENAIVESDRSSALGNNSKAWGGEAATAVGAWSRANGANTAALGRDAQATAASAVAVGHSSRATAASALAAGHGATVEAERGTAIGNNAHASGTKSTALGYHTKASGEYALAIGSSDGQDNNRTTASGKDSIAIGRAAVTGRHALDGIAIGHDAQIVANQGDENNNKHSVAIGYAAKIDNRAYNSVALGSNATVGDSSSSAVAVGDRSSTTKADTVTIGRMSATSALQAIAIGNQASAGAGAGSEGNRSIALGAYAKTTNRFAIAIGSSEAGSNTNTVQATGEHSVAIGTDAKSQHYASVVLGRKSQATQERAVAIGADIQATGQYAVAIGAADSSGQNGTTASAQDAVAVGRGAQATAERAMAFGQSAVANQQNSVALGSSATTEAHVSTENVQYGSGADAVTLNFKGHGNNLVGSVSVGKNNGAEVRQIHNVAAGRVTQNSTDAINGSQLYALATTTMNFKGDTGDTVSRLLGNTLTVRGKSGSGIRVKGIANEKALEIDYTPTTGKLNVGDGLSMTGTGTNRLLGSGDVTINLDNDTKAKINNIKTYEVALGNVGEALTLDSSTGTTTTHQKYTIGFNAQKVAEAVKPHLGQLGATTTLSAGSSTHKIGDQNGTLAITGTDGITTALTGSTGNGTLTIGLDQNTQNAISRATSGAITFKDNNTQVGSTENKLGSSFTFHGSDDITATVATVGTDGKVSFAINKDGTIGGTKDSRIVTGGTVKQYVDGVRTEIERSVSRNANLNIGGDSGSGTVNLGTQTLSITGDSDLITTTASGQGVSIGINGNNLNSRIRTQAQGAVKVVQGKNTTVEEGTSGNAKTYKVNVSDAAIQAAAAGANLSYKAGSETAAKTTALSTGLHFQSGNDNLTAETENGGVVKYTLASALTGIASIANGTGGNGASLTFSSTDKTITANGGKLTGLAEGTVDDTSTDVITGKQLKKALESVKNALGGNSNVNNGGVTQPTFNLTGAGKVNSPNTTPTAKNTVGDAINALDTAIGTLGDKLGDGTLKFAGNQGGDKTVALKDGKLSIVGDGTLVKTTSGDNGTLTISIDDGKLAEKAQGAVNVESANDLITVQDSTASGVKTFTLTANADKLAEGVNLKYKSDADQTAKETALSTGLTFKKTANITTATEAGGVVTHTLNSNLTDIASITNGVTKISLSPTAIGAPNETPKPTINVNGAKITGGADGTIGEDSTDFITGGQLHNLTKELSDAVGGVSFKFNADATDPATADKSIKLNETTFKITGDGKIKTRINDTNDGIALSLDAESVASDVKLKYKGANITGTAQPKDVALGTGLDFQNTDNITTEVGDNGIVKHKLNANLKGISSIKNTENGPTITFGDDNTKTITFNNVDKIDLGNAKLDANINYIANGTPQNAAQKKSVKISDGFNFKDGTHTKATVADNGVVTFDLNEAAAKVITDATTSGILFGANGNGSVDQTVKLTKKFSFVGNSDLEAVVAAEGTDGAKVTLTVKKDGQIADNNEGLVTGGTVKAALDPINTNITNLQSGLDGVNLRFRGDNNKDAALDNNLTTKVNLKDAALNIQGSEATGANDQNVHFITTKAEGQKLTIGIDAAKFKAEVGKAAAGSAMLAYQAEGDTGATQPKTTALSAGLNFKNTTNITATTEANGVVKHSLNADLTGINSIKNGNNGASLTFGNDALTVNDKKLTGLANGSIAADSKDAITGHQLNSLSTALGLAPTSDVFNAPSFTAVKSGKGDQANNLTTVKAAIDGAIAAINSGLTFGADKGTAATQYLGSKLEVKAATTAIDTDFEGTNLKTSYAKDNDGNGTISIGLSKNLKGIHSISKNTDGTGPSITFGDDNTINFGDAKIDANIRYRSNNTDNTAKNVKLSQGFDFTNTTNITSSVEDNGVVKHTLNADLKGITSIKNTDNGPTIKIGDGTAGNKTITFENVEKIDLGDAKLDANLTYRANSTADGHTDTKTVKVSKGLNFVNADNENIKASVGADGLVKHTLNSELKNITKIIKGDGTNPNAPSIELTDDGVKITGEIDANIKYRANSETDTSKVKSVSLKNGFDFIGEDNITTSVEDGGKVTIKLNNSLTLSRGTGTDPLKINENSDGKIKGLADATLGTSSNEAVTGKQLTNLASALGLSVATADNTKIAIPDFQTAIQTVKNDPQAAAPTSLLNATRGLITAVNQGLKFAADSAKQGTTQPQVQQLGSTLEVKSGNLTDTGFVGTNLKTEYSYDSNTGTGTITVGMAKDLKNVTSISSKPGTGTGDKGTTITLKGDTNEVDFGGAKITNIGEVDANLTYRSNNAPDTDATNRKTVKVSKGLNFVNADDENIKASVGEDGLVKHTLNSELKNITKISKGDGKDPKKPNPSIELTDDGVKITGEIDANIKYRANSDTEASKIKTVSLKDGFDFIGEDNITTSVEDNGKVKVKLNNSITLKNAQGADSIKINDNNDGKITGLTEGTVSNTSTDAITGKQLHNALDKLKDALGGGSQVSDGGITAPTFTLNGVDKVTPPTGGAAKPTTKNNVGDAISALDSAVGALSDNLGNATIAYKVRNPELTPNSTSKITSNAKTTKLTDGFIFEGDRNVKTTQQEGGVVEFSLNKKLSGITSITGDPGTAQIDFTQDALKVNSKKVSGLAVGGISDSSTDAITGKQMHSLSNTLLGFDDPDTSGLFTAPSFNAVKSGKGEQTAALTTVKSAIEGTISAINSGLKFGADQAVNGTAQNPNQQFLGSTLNVKTGDITTGSGTNSETKYKGENLITTYGYDSNTGEGTITVGLKERSRFLEINGLEDRKAQNGTAATADYGVNGNVGRAATEGAVRALTLNLVGDADKSTDQNNTTASTGSVTLSTQQLNVVGDKGITVVAKDQGFTVSVDNKTLTDNITITYRANDETDDQAKKVNLKKGLTFVNGDNTTASVLDDGKVKFSVNDTLKNMVAISGKPEVGKGSTKIGFGENAIMLSSINNDGTANNSVDPKLTGLGLGDITDSSKDAITGKQLSSLATALGLTPKTNMFEAPTFAKINKGHLAPNTEGLASGDVKTAVDNLITTVNEGFNFGATAVKTGSTNPNKQNLGTTLKVVEGDLTSADNTHFKGKNLKTEYAYENGEGTISVGLSETPEFKAVDLKGTDGVNGTTTRIDGAGVRVQDTANPAKTLAELGKDKLEIATDDNGNKVVLGKGNDGKGKLTGLEERTVAGVADGQDGTGYGKGDDAGRAATEGAVRALADGGLNFLGNSTEETTKVKRKIGETLTIAGDGTIEGDKDSNTAADNIRVDTDPSMGKMVIKLANALKHINSIESDDIKQNTSGSSFRLAKDTGLGLKKVENGTTTETNTTDSGLSAKKTTANSIENAGVSTTGFTVSHREGTDENAGKVNQAALSKNAVTFNEKGSDNVREASYGLDEATIQDKDKNQFKATATSVEVQDENAANKATLSKTGLVTSNANQTSNLGADSLTLANKGVGNAAPADKTSAKLDRTSLEFKDSTGTSVIKLDSTDKTAKIGNVTINGGDDKLVNVADVIKLDGANNKITVSTGTNKAVEIGKDGTLDTGKITGLTARNAKANANDYGLGDNAGRAATESAVKDLSDQLRGAASPFEYVTANGEKLEKGQDGKFYKAEELAGAVWDATEGKYKKGTNAVDPVDTANVRIQAREEEHLPKRLQVGRLASALELGNYGTDQTANGTPLTKFDATVTDGNAKNGIVAARAAANKLYALDGDKLDRAVTAGDLQAVAIAGLTFKGNDGTKEVHRKLGDTLNIKGEGELAQDAATASGNIRVDVNDKDLIIKLAKAITNITSIESEKFKDGNGFKLEEGKGLTVTETVDGVVTSNETTADGSTITQKDGDKESSARYGLDGASLIGKDGESASFNTNEIALEGKDGDGATLTKDSLTFNDQDDNPVVSLDAEDRTLTMKGEDGEDGISLNAKDKTAKIGNVTISGVNDTQGENAASINGLADRTTGNTPDVQVNGEPATAGYGIGDNVGRAATEGAVRELAEKLNLQEDSSPFTYVDQDGNPLVQGKDGKFYKPADLKGATWIADNTLPGGGKYVKGTDQVAAVESANVNIKAKGSDLRKLMNVGSGIGLTPDQYVATAPAQGSPAGTAPTLEPAKAKAAAEKLYNLSGDSLNNVASVGDLQAMSFAGLNFQGNAADKSIHRKLSDTLVIKGEGDLAQDAPTASGNIRLDISKDNELIVKLAKAIKHLTSLESEPAENGKPSFKLDNEAGLTLTQKDEKGKTTTNVTDAEGSVITQRDPASGKESTAVYNIDGATIEGANGEDVSLNKDGLFVSNADGDEVNVTPDEVSVEDAAGNTNSQTATSNSLTDAAGNNNTHTATSNTLTDAEGNTASVTPTEMKVASADGKNTTTIGNDKISIVNGKDGKDGKDGVDLTATGITFSSTDDPTDKSKSELTRDHLTFHNKDGKETIKIDGEKGTISGITSGTKLADAPQLEGKPLKQANDGKWYLADDVTPKGEPKADTKPAIVMADNGKYYKANAEGKPDMATEVTVGKGGLVDFANSDESAVATVADLQGLGFVVSTSDKDGTETYNDQVRHGNQLNVTGSKDGLVSVTGKTTDGKRELVVDVKRGVIVPESEKFAVDKEGKPLVKVGENYYRPADLDKDGNPTATAKAVPADQVATKADGDGFVTGNQVGAALSKSGFIVGKGEAENMDKDPAKQNRDERINPEDEIRFADGKNSIVTLTTKDDIDATGNKKTITTVRVDVDLPIKDKYTVPEIEFEPEIEKDPQTGKPVIDPTTGKPKPVIDPITGKPKPAIDETTGKPKPVIDPTTGKPKQVIDPTTGKPKEKEVVKAKDGNFYDPKDVNEFGKPNPNAKPVDTATTPVKRDVQLEGEQYAGKDGKDGADGTNANVNKGTDATKDVIKKGTGGVNINNVGWAENPDQAVNKDQLDQTVAKSGFFVKQNNKDVNTKGTDGSELGAEKVTPNDVVNFNNGANTLVNVETKRDENGVDTTNVSVHVTGLPMTYTAKVDGKDTPVTKVGNKFYAVGEDGKPNFEKEVSAGAMANADIALLNPLAAPNEVSKKPVRISNVAAATDSLPNNPNFETKEIGGKLYDARDVEVTYEAKKPDEALVKIGDDFYKPQDVEIKKGKLVPKADVTKVNEVMELDGLVYAKDNVEITGEKRRKGAEALTKIGDDYYRTSDVENGKPKTGVIALNKQQAADADAYAGLANLAGAKDTDVFTVNDAKRLGFVVGTRNTDPKASKEMYADKVQNANKLEFVGGNNIEVTGITKGNSREVQIRMVENPEFESVQLYSKDKDGNRIAGTNLRTDANGNLHLSRQLRDQNGNVVKDKEGNAIEVPVIVTGIAPGRIEAGSTDAVTGGQVHELAEGFGKQLQSSNQRLSAGIAGAYAMAGLIPSTLPGERIISVAGGSYKGQNAVALGISATSDNGRFTIRASGTRNSMGEFGASIGAGYRW